MLSETPSLIYCRAGGPEFQQGMQASSRMSGGHFYEPIFAAGVAGELDLAVVQRDAAWPGWHLTKTKRPVVLLLQDDWEPEAASTGPGGWQCAGRVRQWARGALIHGTGGQAEHYRLAVVGALTLQRFVIIETASRHVVPWAEALGTVPKMAILPPVGATHPDCGREVRH